MSLHRYHRSDLAGRSMLKQTDLTREEFLQLVNLGGQFRKEKRLRFRLSRLAGRRIVLIFERASTRTRSIFEAAAHDEGAHVTYLGPDEPPLGRTESVKDTARMLGRIFDGIEYRGFGQESVETLAEYAGVPVWNEGTDAWRPTQMLADVLTMRDHTAKPLEEVCYCYLGDGRNNTANSLLVTGALLGMDVRICAPEALWPSPEVRGIAENLAVGSGARLTVTSEIEAAVAGADFIYTDGWLSMSEPADERDERIGQLLPYQVNDKVLAATGNASVKFLHCLPALHNTDTEIGQQLCERHGLEALEVTEQVFESPASVVFDQARNRLHTTKALMVATIPPRS